jgi:hypothetical protein
LVQFPRVVGDHGVCQQGQAWACNECQK